jgi:tetratricopeptide (TPR) repeat protein
MRLPVMSVTLRACALVTALTVIAPACASNARPSTPADVVTPRFADFPMPVVPPGLAAPPERASRHEAAWKRLQAGDLAAAEREFTALLQEDPAFYPAAAGLGFVALARRDYRRASTQFAAATSADDTYLPAWQGQVEAKTGLRDDRGAIEALQRVIAIDPRQDSARARLDVLRDRRVQALIDSARRARASGRADEASTQLEEARVLAPAHALIYREMAATERARHALPEAEAHARRAIELAPNDAEAHALLGAVLEERGQLADAADAFMAAAKIEARSEWRERAERLRARAAEESIPAEFRALPSAATVTRSQLAALIGMRLEPVLAQAPARPPVIATDVRGHWAEKWILAVTQAGVMSVSPSHTFQPSLPVRRSDLANVVSDLLTIIGARHPSDLAAWKAARPRFVDLPPANVFYPAAALAVAAGAMKPNDNNRFGTTQPASGEDVLAAIARLEQLAGR